MFIRRNPNQQYRRVAKRAFRGKGVFPAPGGRGRSPGSGVPPRCPRRGGWGAENAAFSTV